MNSVEEQASIEELLLREVESLQVKAMIRLLELRREKHRDNLEKSDVGEHRGRARECGDLLKIFTINS